MKEFDYSDENIKRTIKADYFQRNVYIKNLINYINATDEQTTYAISGEWGSGKTVFMHQLMYVIKNRDVFGDRDFKNTQYDDAGKKDMEVFYYNAWESELLKQPSIAILKSITNRYYLFSDDERQIAKDVLEKLTNIVVKIGSVGILDAGDFGVGKKDVEDELDINHIKQSFRAVIDYILEKKSCKKVVIIVDELDRCKPTTVVNMLEEVKHFYEHESLCFIFSADFKQLGYTIKRMYGENFDADLYLQRFFDSTFMLNSSDYEKYISNELLYSIDNTHIAHEICKVAISYNSLSIRETNKFVKKIKVIENEVFDFDGFNPELAAVRAVFVPWAIALKYKNSSGYHTLIDGNLKEDDIRHYLDTSKGLTRWLTECCYRRRDIEGIDICAKLFENYKRIFRKAGFKYYEDEYQDMRTKRRILSFIEF